MSAIGDYGYTDVGDKKGNEMTERRGAFAVIPMECGHNSVKYDTMTPDAVGECAECGAPVLLHHVTGPNSQRAYAEGFNDGCLKGREDEQAGLERS